MIAAKAFVVVATAHIQVFVPLSYGHVGDQVYNGDVANVTNHRAMGRKILLLPSILTAGSAADANGGVARASLHPPHAPKTGAYHCLACRALGYLSVFARWSNDLEYLEGGPIDACGRLALIG